MISIDRENSHNAASVTGPNRDLLDRVIASPHFSKSGRLSSFLLYVCDLTLNGRADDISERKIGEAVFGRSPDYDPTIDGIVRTQASRLRQKLDLYFDGEGANEPIRIVIPRGGYVPFFVPRTSNQMAVPVSVLDSSEESSTVLPEASQVQVKRSGSVVLAWSLVGILAIAILALFYRNTLVSAKAQTTSAANHPLWSKMFPAGQDTIIVPGDSSLVVWEGLMNRDIGLAEYLSGEYRTSAPAAAATLQKIAPGLARRRYTSIVDLEMVQSLSLISKAERGKLQVRYARDLRPNDLKQGNIILSGAREANPWVQLFEADMNFAFSYDRPHQIASVVNRAPRGNEPKKWDFVDADVQHRVYGVVAYLPNLSGDGNVLILEGTSMAGTECAWDFVSDDSQLLPFLKQIQSADRTLPHFEVMLGTNNMSGNAVKNNILAWRTIR